jgi:hypothetical protein
MAEIDAIGMLNNRWGVCGFSSALYAFYENSDTLQQDKSKLANSAALDTRFIAEIKGFLKQLEADGDAFTLADIASFTRTFAGYDGFAIAEYIRQIDVVGVTNAPRVWDNFSIAMPPEAVVAYLKYIGFQNPAIVAGTDPDKRTEALVGLKDKNGKMVRYGGLAHWVYKKGGVYYTWGRQFTKFEDMGYPGVCVLIAPNG